MIFFQRAGRRLRSRHILLNLDNHTIYTPARILARAIRQGLCKGWTKERRKSLRHSLGALSKSRAFPNRGDGDIRNQKGRYFKGWYGWRWKVAAGASLLDLL